MSIIERVQKFVLVSCALPVIKHIQQHGKISAIEAEKLWKLTRRTATNRLKKMCQEGLLVGLSTGPFDSYKKFILAEPRRAFNQECEKQPCGDIVATWLFRALHKI